MGTYATYTLHTHIFISIEICIGYRVGLVVVWCSLFLWDSQETGKLICSLLYTDEAWQIAAPKLASLNLSWLSALLEVSPVTAVWIGSSSETFHVNTNSQVQNLCLTWILQYSVKLFLWSFLSLNSFFSVLMENRHGKENKNNSSKRLTKHCTIFFSISITLVNQLNCESPLRIWTMG